MSASAVLKLQKVGFTAEQVEALADFMDTQAASKADLMEAKADLKADIARVEANVAAAKIDILKTMMGAIALNSAVVIGAMFGLAKLLGH